jgi:hypothetical protein
MRRQTDVRCALRSAPPNAIWLARLRTPVPSAAAAVGTCGVRILAAVPPKGFASPAGWFDLAGEPSPQRLRGAALLPISRPGGEGAAPADRANFLQPLGLLKLASFLGVTVTELQEGLCGLCGASHFRITVYVANTDGKGPKNLSPALKTSQFEAAGGG